DEHEKTSDEKTEEKDKNGPESIQLFPWLIKSDDDSVKEYYKEIQGHGSVLSWQKKRVDIRQKTPSGGNTIAGVEILLIIPYFLDMRIIGMESKGTHVLFVNEQAIKLDDIPIFLQPMTFVIQSSELKVTSTRENLIDHKNTFNEIIKSVIKMAIPLLKEKLQEDIEKHMPTWEFYIKSGYAHAKNENLIALKDLFIPILPFTTQNGSVLLGDVLAETEKEVLYANIVPVDLPKNVYHPLLDGIDQKIIILSGFLDEQIVNSFEHKGKIMKNIADKKFDNLDRKGEEELIDFCKKTLGSLVDQVILSQRLKNAPFSLKEKHTQFSAAHKKMLGDYVIRSSFFRKTIESDIILEINPDAIEIQEINVLLANKELEKAADAVRIGVAAASVLCNINFIDRRNEFLGLLNVQRRILGLDQLEIKEKKEEKIPETPEDVKNEEKQVDEPEVDQKIGLGDVKESDVEKQEVTEQGEAREDL
ncbi:Molecular chaperone (HSP90 family), partial [Pseudoloma neurophilia]